jgi:hypothetical protein
MNLIVIAGALFLGLVASSSAQAQTFGSSVPAQVQTRVKADIEFIGSVTGSAPSALHQKIFGKIDGATYVNWFQSRIDTFEYDQDRTDGAVAYVDPSQSDSTMFVTKYFVNNNQPQIARLLVMFHEARHTEAASGFWTHVMCPVPFLDDNGKDMVSIFTGIKLEGKPGCDSTAIGAYGSSLILLKNISLSCTSCTSKVKMDAGIYADDQVGRLINPSAKQKIRQDLYATAP